MTVALLMLITSVASMTTYSYGSADCYTDTSEGFRTIKHGDYACAALSSDSAESNKGRIFIICNSGFAATMSCAAPLRFDVISKTCNWPHLATCSLPDKEIMATLPSTITTTTESTLGATQKEESTTLLHGVLTPPLEKDFQTENVRRPLRDSTTHFPENIRHPLRDSTTHFPENVRHPLRDSTTHFPENVRHPLRDSTTHFPENVRHPLRDSTTHFPEHVRHSLRESTTHFPENVRHPLRDSTTHFFMELTTPSKTESPNPNEHVHHPSLDSTPFLPTTLTTISKTELSSENVTRPSFESTTHRSPSKTESPSKQLTYPPLESTTHLPKKLTPPSVTQPPFEIFTHFPGASPSENVTYPPLESTTHFPQVHFPPSVKETPHEHVTHPSLPRGPCREDNCELPNCFCYGSSPTNISVSDTPMFIMLSFDDAVTTDMYEVFLKDLLVDNKYELYNPTGCNIRATFYLSHAYTDYNRVATLHKAGHEIASHTINHKLPSGRDSNDYQDIVDEIVGLKIKVQEETGNVSLAESIVGFRAPYLEVAGNLQYDVLRDFSFLYDTSVPNMEIQRDRKPLWPFTLDFVMASCVHPPCPTQPYPGLWEVPMNSWVGVDGRSCSMIDSCTVSWSKYGGSVQDWYTFFRQNFDDSFYQLRIPMGIFTHAAMFVRSRSSYMALVTFLKDVLAKGDVWMATPTQAIRWIQNPVTNSQMLQEKWGC